MNHYHTVREEITKYLINENIIKDFKTVRRWSWEKLIKFYFKAMKNNFRAEGSIH